MNASSTHLVLVPSYNSGPLLVKTVRAALDHWSPVWIVIDGSTDGSVEQARALAAQDGRVRVIERAAKGGKGAAVETGLEAALAAGFTHVLAMDADGQHPAEQIPVFMEASRRQPGTLILGKPIFGPEAPRARLYGRKLSALLGHLEVGSTAVADPLFGFRVYPAAPLRRVLRATRFARGYDFDQETAVRLVWAGTPTINLPAPCRYVPKGEGGVSHFHYLRDNLLLIWLHLRLLLILCFCRPFRKRLALVAALLAAAPAFAANPLYSPATEIADPARDPAWAGLFRRLAPRQNQVSAFEERRFFPFRRKPIVLTGEIRISPQRGLSLAYAAPQARIMVFDRQGMLLREAGVDAAAPDDPRAQRAVAALVDVLQFDLPALRQNFDLHGERAGSAWTIAFLPRGPELAASLQAVEVSGEDGEVRRIELIGSPRQRVEILVSHTRRGVAFDAAAVARYFR